MSDFSIHVYCSFSGMSMSLPFGNVENVRRASDLAMGLVGQNGRTVSSSGEEFYLETVDQLDALLALQRRLDVRPLVETRRAAIEQAQGG